MSCLPTTPLRHWLWLLLAVGACKSDIKPKEVKLELQIYIKPFGSVPGLPTQLSPDLKDLKKPITKRQAAQEALPVTQDPDNFDQCVMFTFYNVLGKRKTPEEKKKKAKEGGNALDDDEEDEEEESVYEHQEAINWYEDDITLKLTIKEGIGTDQRTLTYTANMDELIRAPVHEKRIEKFPVKYVEQYDRLAPYNKTDFKFGEYQDSNATYKNILQSGQSLLVIVDFDRTDLAVLFDPLKNVRAQLYDREDNCIGDSNNQLPG